MDSINTVKVERMRRPSGISDAEWIEELEDERHSLYLVLELFKQECLKRGITQKMVEEALRADLGTRWFPAAVLTLPVNLVRALFYQYDALKKELEHK